MRAAAACCVVSVSFLPSSAPTRRVEFLQNKSADIHTLLCAPIDCRCQLTVASTIVDRCVHMYRRIVSFGTVL